MRQAYAAIAIVVFFSGSPAAQTSAPRSTEAATFIGTWAVTMTEPDELKGSQQMVRIWDDSGVIRASLQVGKFPARDVTAIVKDANMLVLTISHDARPPMLENGAPIWAVISLAIDGETLKIAQMLERSRTIKRGMGKKVAN
jgi:hypothetical protein